MSDQQSKATSEAEDAAIEHAWTLLESGKVQSALDVLMPLAAEGRCRSCVEVARARRQLGDWDGAAFWLSKAAQAISEGGGSAMDHFACHVGYSEGLGSQEFDEQEVLSNYHLKMAAERGNVIAQILYAQQALWGLNGQSRSEDEYEKWIATAVSSGSPAAILSHARNMLNLSRPFDLAFESRLRELANQNPDAAKILNEYLRQQRNSMQRNSIQRTKPAK